MTGNWLQQMHVSMNSKNMKKKTLYELLGWIFLGFGVGVSLFYSTLLLGLLAALFSIIFFGFSWACELQERIKSLEEKETPGEREEDDLPENVLNYLKQEVAKMDIHFT